MMPRPPGKSSARRAGNGFQISKTRKSINPATKYFQFSRPAARAAVIFAVMGSCGGGAVQALRASPTTNEMVWPESSSITTYPGSGLQGAAATTRSLAHRPIAARARSKVNSETKMTGPASERVTAAVPETRTTAAAEPHVPGAIGRYPTPRLVATASANNGRATSGFAVITFSLVGFRSFFSFLVEERFGDHIFFRSPVPQVQQPAALAAKREIGMDRGIHRFAANRAMVLHRPKTLLSTRFAST